MPGPPAVGGSEGQFSPWEKRPPCPGPLQRQVRGCRERGQSTGFKSSERGGRKGRAVVRPASRPADTGPGQPGGRAGTSSSPWGLCPQRGRRGSDTHTRRPARPAPCGDRGQEGGQAGAAGLPAPDTGVEAQPRAVLPGAETPSCRESVRGFASCHLSRGPDVGGLEAGGLSALGQENETGAEQVTGGRQAGRPRRRAEGTGGSALCGARAARWQVLREGRWVGEGGGRSPGHCPTGSGTAALGGPPAPRLTLCPFAYTP